MSSRCFLFGLFQTCIGKQNPILIMKKIILFIGVTLFFMQCDQKPKSTESQEETATVTSEVDDGWQTLFDGKTKNGWHIYNNKSEGTAWEIEDGSLHLNPKEIIVTPVPGAGDLTQAVGGGDIATDEEYDNFHLKLEWKVGNPSNSGIMMFVQEVPEHDYPWQTGPEIQLMHQRECDEEKNCVGDLYSLVAGPRDLVINEGWNNLEVISVDNTLEVIMNGRQLYKTNLWDDAWRANIASTKFTYWPDFGTYNKGKIVLQDHGHEVWFRDIKIKRL